MDWAYLAGFTDGDGCITREMAKRTYVYARIRWAQKQSESEVLQEVAKFLRHNGIKVTERNFSVSRKGHKYPQTELSITNAEDTRRVLIQLLPHLVVKRDRALEALSVMNFVHQQKVKYGNKYRAWMCKESA